MKLAEYIKYKKLTQEDASKAIGISRQMLNMILKKRAVPGREVTKKIVAWSNGDVKIEDLWR